MVVVQRERLSSAPAILRLGVATVISVYCWFDRYYRVQHIDWWKWAQLPATPFCLQDKTEDSAILIPHSLPQELPPQPRREALSTAHISSCNAAR